MAKRYSSTLVLCSILVFAASAWTGTFMDNFEDGDLEDWRQFWPEGEMIWEVVDGELECARLDQWSAELVTGGDFWTDYTIEFDLKLLEDHGPGDFGIIVRVTTSDNGYSFLIGDWIGEPAVYVQRWPDLNMKATRPFGPLETGIWHHVELEVAGSDFNLWINDEKVIEYQDDKYPNGMVGFGVANYTIRCDNVIITGPDVPDEILEFGNDPVEPRGKLATTWAGIKTN